MSRLDCLQTVFSALISPVSTMASVWGGALGWLCLLCWQSTHKREEPTSVSHTTNYQDYPGTLYVGSNEVGLAVLPYGCWLYRSHVQCGEWSVVSPATCCLQYLLVSCVLFIFAYIYHSIISSVYPVVLSVFFYPNMYCLYLKINHCFDPPQGGKKPILKKILENNTNLWLYFKSQYL